MKIKLNVKVAEKKRVEKKIDTDYIRLDAFLKMNDAVQSGGHAKLEIQDGKVKVNGEVCEQRGKKLRPGDEVEYNWTIYKVIN